MYDITTISVPYHINKEKIDFDAEVPNLIVEEDFTVLEDISPAVNYKEVMLDFEAKRFFQDLI